MSRRISKYFFKKEKQIRNQKKKNPYSVQMSQAELSCFQSAWLHQR
jgi:hypothetical protein